MSLKPLVTEEVIARQPLEAQAIIRMLLARIAEQDRRIAALEAEVAALKKSPRNSSLPPSTEHPHAKPPSQKKSSSKKPGGQPGHAKYERRLIAVEQCTQVAAIIPEMCRRCGEPLAGYDPEPLRHQVWDVPELEADRDVQAALRSSRLALDVSRRGRSRADQQRQRTGLASRRDLAEVVVWHAKRSGQPLRGNDPHRRRNLPTPITKQLRLPDHRHPSTFGRSTNSVTVGRDVNGYGEALPVAFEIVDADAFQR